jgi:predicted nucleotide-binding protein
MTVWIVMRSGKVDEVFDNEAAALAHKEALTRKWALTEIIQKEVKSL